MTNTDDEFMANLHCEQEETRVAYESLPTVTPELLAVLERRASPSPEPSACSVCGGPMGIGEVSGAGVMWRCDAASEAMLRPYDRVWMAHYQQSKMSQYNTGDSLVLALVAAYRAREVRDAEDACSDSGLSSGSPS